MTSDDLLESLDWNLPKRVQRVAIGRIVADPDRFDLGALALPRRKSAFRNSAEVLTRIGRPRIDAHLPALLEWLQDLNWPGAWQVFDLLAAMDRATLLPHFRAAVDKARAEHDDGWEEFLGSLADARGDLRAECGPWIPVAG